MLSMTWTAAPAGVAGLGADVRPYAVECAAVRPDLSGARVAVQGTGVPTGDVILRHRGTGLFTTGMSTATTFAPLSQQFDQIPQHDGTTLGFHPSGRPLS
jgi:hypothetical protein